MHDFIDGPNYEITEMIMTSLKYIKIPEISLVFINALYICMYKYLIQNQNRWGVSMEMEDLCHGFTQGVSPELVFRIHHNSYWRTSKHKI